jgi:ABC-type spermidine/putrescine transport system permease subunit II
MMTLYKLVMEALAASVGMLVSIPLIYVIYLSVRRSELQVIEPPPISQTWIESSFHELTAQELRAEKNNPLISHQQLEEQSYMPRQLSMD